MVDPTPNSLHANGNETMPVPIAVALKFTIDCGILVEDRVVGVVNSRDGVAEEDEDRVVSKSSTT